MIIHKNEEFSHALALWLIISHIFTSQFPKHEILLHDLQHYGQQSVEAEDAVSELLLLLLRQRRDQRLHAARLKVGHLEGVLGGK